MISTKKIYYGVSRLIGRMVRCVCKLLSTEKQTNYRKLEESRAFHNIGNRVILCDRIEFIKRGMIKNENQSHSENSRF